jgi:RNA polymerase sigma-70 factor, ECF subfamily
MSPTATTLSPDCLPAHLPRLRRVAWRISGSADAGEDLLQDTLERVLRSPRRVSCGDEFVYLARALRNTHVDRLRAASRQVTTVEMMPEHEPASSPSADETAAVSFDTGRVLDAIAALPEQYQKVVVAVDVQGASYAEAAELIGIPIGTVMSRLYRGRERVIRAFEDDQA